ncbi:hypothetical protein Tco_1205971 [Tanacetum coccineum]
MAVNKYEWIQGSKPYLLLILSPETIRTDNANDGLQNCFRDDDALEHGPLLSVGSSNVNSMLVSERATHKYPWKLDSYIYRREFKTACLNKLQRWRLFVTDLRSENGTWITE